MADRIASVPIRGDSDSARQLRRDWTPESYYALFELENGDLLVVFPAHLSINTDEKIDIEMIVRH